VITASAPGKLILAGEYAVLDGAEAIVIAVNRRAVARVTDEPQDQSRFLTAVVDMLNHCADPDGAAIARRVVVDSSALSDGDVKLGLGSSAAAVVAASACAMAARGTTPSRKAIYNLAAAAHRIAQENHGSGADVAASVHGGTIGFQGGRVRPFALPADLTLIPIWTGHAADTVSLVARVTASRPAWGDIVAASTALAAATDARAAIAAIDAGADAIVALGKHAGVVLEPPVVTAARRIAASVGGAAKTTGAGGGDVAIVALPASADATIVRARLIEAGCRPLDLAIDPLGVDIHPVAE
jgi:phosphomevalonate kinase